MHRERERGTKNEAVNAEDHTTFCGEEEPAYRRSKTKYAQREREAQRISVFIQMQQIQNNSNNNQPLQKVTRSLYIVTHLGKLPFRLFTQIA